MAVDKVDADDFDVLDKSAITALMAETKPKKKAVSKRMSAEERLNQIIDVAVRLIGQKGYHGLSLQDIASEIGVTQTAVIHRVKSKHNLLVLVVERYYDMSGAETEYLGHFRAGGGRAGGVRISRPRCARWSNRMCGNLKWCGCSKCSTPRPCRPNIRRIDISWSAPKACGIISRSLTGRFPKGWTACWHISWPMPPCMGLKAVGWPIPRAWTIWRSGKDMRRICSRRRSGMGIGDVRGRFVGERR